MYAHTNTSSQHLELKLTYTAYIHVRTHTGAYTHAHSIMPCHAMEGFNYSHEQTAVPDLQQAVCGGGAVVDGEVLAAVQFVEVPVNGDEGDEMQINLWKTKARWFSLSSL